MLKTQAQGLFAEFAKMSNPLTLIAGLTAGLATSSAMAIECVAPPPTYQRDYAAQFSAAALKVKGLVGPSAGLTVKSETLNLLARIPHADKVLVELTYLHALCTALRDDDRLSEERKARLLMQYRQGLQQPAARAAAPARSGSGPATRAATVTPPAAKPAKPLEPVSTTQIVRDNAGPVVIGNQVQGDLTVNGPAK